MTDSTIITLGKLGCTGYIDYNGRLLHDGDTCPVHETETIDALACPDCGASITPNGDHLEGFCPYVLAIDDEGNTR